MLVLSRKDGEWIQIGDARIVILHASHGQVSLGVEAPREVTILRGELVEQGESERDAAQARRAHEGGAGRRARLAAPTGGDGARPLGPAFCAHE